MIKPIFRLYAKKVHDVLKEEGFPLYLKGLEETLFAYKEMKEGLFQDLFWLQTHLHFWEMYLSSLLAFVSYRVDYYVLELEINEGQPLSTEQGEREKYLTERQKEFQLFQDLLTDMVKYMQGASKHTGYMYKQSVKSMKRTIY